MPAVTRSQIAQRRGLEKPPKPGSSRKSTADRRSFFQKWDPMVWIPRLLFDPAYLWTTGILVLILEVFICAFVVLKVPYTEIDWTAYMEQVGLFINGTWNYTALVGGTGPLVYPGGHVWIYSALYLATSKGTQIRVAQWIFAALYMATLVVLFQIYHRIRKVPPYVLFFMCCGSYRVHSIFMLRLFNDPVAMFLLYCAVLLWMYKEWTAGCIFYSLAVGVKMNILLFAPAVFAVLLVNQGPLYTLGHIFINCGLTQLFMAIPFIVANPVGYLTRSFELSRQFLYQWTVNWRFVPEWLFLDRRFHLGLLAAHLTVLTLFAFFLWFRRAGGLCKLISKADEIGPYSNRQHNDDILFGLFSANFIGMSFARTLHYQFYSWYFHSIPFLLWSTNFPPVMKLATMGTLELIWNTYPSTRDSSLALHAIHIMILAGMAYAKWRERPNSAPEKTQVKKTD